MGLSIANNDLVVSPNSLKVAITWSEGGQAWLKGGRVDADPIRSPFNPV